MCGRYGQVDGGSSVAEKYKATIDQKDPFGLKLGSPGHSISDDEAEEIKKQALGKEKSLGGQNYNTSPGNFSIMILNTSGDW